ncbi:MAG: sigma-70 family RNA polymerase sigma factor [Solibacillus sp.]
MNQLIQLACTGDEQAFEEIVQLHKTKLTAAAFSYTKDYMEAQDIVQETFIKAYQSIHQLKEPAYFSTWLYKILIRQCFHHLKAKKRATKLAFELQQLQLIQDDHSPHFDELYEALNVLKENYRTVILLHYFYDFKLNEIANLVDKPLNTIKIQLHRARAKLKQQLERSTLHTIKQQDVKSMLNHLKEAALQYFSIPSSFTLTIEDINEEGATFLWKEAHLEECFYIELNKNGQLLSLSQPVNSNNISISAKEQQEIAEQFMTAQYNEALNYFTLATINTKPESKRYYYYQFVYGIPLQSPYCIIEISNSGQLIDFEYKAYQVNPPQTPATLAGKEPILEKLTNAEWTTQLEYLSSKYYTVPHSGLYVVYHSSFLYHSFDAATGKDLCEQIETEEIEIEQQEKFVPLPQVEPDVPLHTIEDIIGLTTSMELIRKSEKYDGYIGMVWRDQTTKQPTDKSMNQFFLDRFEHTVKATVNEATGELRGFVWFKERTGSLSLSFKQCEKIAVKFIKTYFPAFIPYLHMKVKDASFNEANRASFHFNLFVDGLPLKGEFFRLSVNKTTGLVDMLMAPKLEVKVLEVFRAQPLLPVEQAKEALKEADAVLEWDKRYKMDEPIEILIYKFKSRESALPIGYIEATTGELILEKE